MRFLQRAASAEMPRALLGLSTVLLCGAIAACAVAPAPDSASGAGGDAPAAASAAAQAHASAPARLPRPAARARRPAVPLTDPDTPPALREPAPTVPAQAPAPAPETDTQQGKSAKDDRASGLGLDLGSELGDFGEEGMASWYGARFHSRRTASGERFDMNDFTAAHRTLPFGTRVCVRSLVTGRAVQVRINDRGPHSPSRIVDLSRAAAQSLGLLGLGIKPVAITLAPSDPDAPCPGSDSVKTSGG